jgi:hypothetical protein
MYQVTKEHITEQEGKAVEPVRSYMGDVTIIIYKTK